MIAAANPTHAPIVAAIRAALDEGLPVRAIAARVGKSRRYVQDLMSHKGWRSAYARGGQTATQCGPQAPAPVVVRTDAQAQAHALRLERIREIIATGVSTRIAAAEIGMGARQLRRLMAYEGIKSLAKSGAPAKPRPPKRHCGWTAGMDAILTSMRAANRSVEDISKEVGRSLASVKKRIKLLNLPRKPAGFRPVVVRVVEPRPVVVVRPPVVAVSAPQPASPGAVVHVSRSVSSVPTSSQRVEKARAMLMKRADPHDVYLATKLPLHECYRLRGEIREAARA